MTNLSFQVLRCIFSLVTCGLIAWTVDSALHVGVLPLFLVLFIGLPILVWIQRIISLPGYLAAAWILHKRLLTEMKQKLSRLPIKSAEEWNELIYFSEVDSALAEHCAKDPKAFVAAARYESNAIRRAGRPIQALHNSWLLTQAMQQLWDEYHDKEFLDIARAHGFESWAEYMVVHGHGEDVRRSYEAAAARERQKRAARVAA